MKKVFIDTNVILDFILHREHWAEAKDVVAYFVEKRTEMVMSVGGFYTMHYPSTSISARSFIWTRRPA